VRIHGDLARIEISRTEMQRALELSLLDCIAEGIESLGFKFVTLDLKGFRSGSLN
jgi:pyridinium-3,5-biscarboxylic acid mononucleotide sulfurtransferase